MNKSWTWNLRSHEPPTYTFLECTSSSLCASNRAEVIPTLPPDVVTSETHAEQSPIPMLPPGVITHSTKVTPKWSDFKFWEGLGSGSSTEIKGQHKFGLRWSGASRPAPQSMHVALTAITFARNGVSMSCRNHDLGNLKIRWPLCAGDTSSTQLSHAQETRRDISAKCTDIC